jgi:hypothetical protein
MVDWHLRRLVVEGREDTHSIGNLLRRHGFDFGVQFKTFLTDAGGEPEVLSEAEVALKSLQAVGIVIDADGDPTSRWVRYREAFRRLSLELPDALPREGLVVPGLRPGTTLALWQMPDNDTAGILEDFIATLVPNDDPCWTFADEAVSTARSFGAPLRPIDQTKGQLHTWLSWRNPPGLSIGSAIKAKILSDDSPLALSFVKWFRTAFGVEQQST